MKSMSKRLLLGSLVSVFAFGCATDGTPAASGTDQVEQPQQSTFAPAAPHPCSWAEMDIAQAACDKAHSVETRTQVLSCTITACNATSTMIYYSYLVE